MIPECYTTYTTYTAERPLHEQLQLSQRSEPTGWNRKTTVTFKPLVVNGLTLDILLTGMDTMHIDDKAELTFPHKKTFHVKCAAISLDNDFPENEIENVIQEIFKNKSYQHTFRLSN